MNILAVESSCDETAVAIVRDGREILTDCIASQVAEHRIYGGVVPEIASRKHVEAIYGLADEALMKMMKQAGAAAEPEDVHVSPELLEKALKYHSYMRYRILLTRLMPMMKLDILDFVK